MLRHSRVILQISVLMQQTENLPVSVFYGRAMQKKPGGPHDLKGHFLAAADGSLELRLPGECGQLRATLTSWDNDRFIPPPPDGPDCLRMTPQKKSHPVATMGTDVPASWAGGIKNT